MGKRNLEKEGKVFKREKKSSKNIRNRSNSPCSSVESSSSTSHTSNDEEIKKKLKKKIKRLRKKEKLKKKKKEKKALKKLLESKLKQKILDETKKNETPCTSCNVDVNLMKKSEILAPMTKEEWEKQQNTFKRVFDEKSGRMRLVKGTGEIVEECISKERHLAINKQATKGDGEFFQKKLLEQIK